MAITRPDTPAAGSVCPMQVFPALSTKGPRRPVPSTALAAPTSMGSPRAVPVPCICRFPTGDPPRPASSAILITDC